MRPIDCTNQRGTAGCRRIAAILNDEGHPASVGLIADLMRELGLAAVQRNAYKRTTVPDEKAQVFALKNEMYHQQVFHTRARARFAVAEYIEVFYNRRRPHSSLGYRTPARAWADAHANAAEDLTEAA
ncbi:hypothetical protein A2U19_03485 [Dietzia maris]|nr:hypothetical protein A2U19_03485 [Dietzia maris]